MGMSLPIGYETPDLRKGLPIYSSKGDGRIVAYTKEEEPERWDPIIINGHVVGHRLRSRASDDQRWPTVRRLFFRLRCTAQRMIRAVSDRH